MAKSERFAGWIVPAGCVIAFLVLAVVARVVIPEHQTDEQAISERQ